MVFLYFNAELWGISWDSQPCLMTPAGPAAKALAAQALTPAAGDLTIIVGKLWYLT